MQVAGATAVDGACAPGRRRPFALLVLVALVGALVLVPLAPGRAAALTPIEPDNRPTAVPGASNGQLSASLLLQIAPTCVAHAAAAPSLAAMIAAAAASGVTIKPSECYRDLAGQKYWRTHYCNLGQCQLAAVPGTSNHGWGKAADLADQSGGLSFTSAGYKWLKLNAGKYGWNHPGWAEPGSSAAEPWHWEWVGDGGTKYPGLVYPTPVGTGIVVGGNPIGSFDAVAVNGPGRITVQGWTLDPDVTAPIKVHVYVDGTRVAESLADGSRPDIAGAYPVYGSRHGFAIGASAGTGAHEVCVFAINTGLGQVNPRLACRPVTLPGNPIGSLDGVTVSRSGVATVHGWTLDPDTTSPIVVHVYADGARVALPVAGGRRDDVGAAFPAYGAAHGFSAPVPLGHGTHDICVYAINQGFGDVNPLLGCRRVEVNLDPRGSLDAVTVANGRVTVAGWALDPEVTAPIDVHVWVDGTRAAALPASGSRLDVAAAYPGMGAGHGFAVSVVVPHGSHTVCVFAINVGGGATNPRLGCASTVL